MAEFDMEEILEAYRRKWEEHRAGAAEYRPPVYKCPHCKDTGFLNLYPPNPRKSAGGKISTMIYCPNCRTNMLKDISGIIAEYRELDIRKFPWETYKKDITKLRQTIESFVYDFRRWRDEGVGLYIYSEAKGSGKTMAASAICNSICAKYNMAARISKFEDFFEDIQKSYDSRSKNELSKVNIRKFFETELLVLDDLGVSKISDKGKGVLHDLINERYKADRLCVITSNYSPENLPIYSATIDRINDMCLVLHFPEEPIRSQKALGRKSKLMQLVDGYDKFTDATGDVPFESGGT